MGAAGGEECPEYFLVTIRRSKTDQEGGVNPARMIQIYRPAAR